LATLSKPIGVIKQYISSAMARIGMI